MKNLQDKLKRQSVTLFLPTQEETESKHESRNEDVGNAGRKTDLKVVRAAIQSWLGLIVGRLAIHRKVLGLIKLWQSSNGVKQFSALIQLLSFKAYRERLKELMRERDTCELHKEILPHLS